MKVKVKLLIMTIIILINSSIYLIIVKKINFAFYLVKEVRGKVINTVTKELIPGIKIERFIDKVDIMSRNHFDYVFFTTTTDNNGFFYFPKTIITYNPLLYYITDYFNGLNINANRTLIDEVEFDIYGFDYSYQRDNPAYYLLGDNTSSGSHIDSINDIDNYKDDDIYELNPEVNSFEECLGNNLCVQENAFNIALKDNNPDACLQIGHERYARCLSIFAIKENNQKICNKSTDTREWSGCLDYFKIYKEKPCNEDFDSVTQNLCLNVFNNTSTRGSDLNIQKESVDPTVEKSNNAISNLLFALLITTLIELLVGLFYCIIRKVNLKLLLFILLVNIISLPIAWLILFLYSPFLVFFISLLSGLTQW